MMPVNFFNKRLTIFAGHYGSGKTTLAVNCALILKNNGYNVTICDLDIVNPYFKTAGYSDIFSKNKIKLICSNYANTNIDAPALPPEINSIFDNSDADARAVIDLGGDEKGASALGRYSRRLKSGFDYEMLLVVNRYRPLTRDIDSLFKIKSEIESASGCLFTGICNNPNLGRETKREDITGSLGFAEEASVKLVLPVKMTAVNNDLCEGLQIENVLPVGMFCEKSWDEPRIR